MTDKLSLLSDQFVLRQIAAERCSGGWGPHGGDNDCLTVNAMHICPSCFVRRYLKTGEVTLRATEHLAARVIAGALSAYSETFRFVGRVDVTFWPARNEVEVHVHGDELGDSECRTIYPRPGDEPFAGTSLSLRGDG